MKAKGAKVAEAPKGSPYPNPYVLEMILKAMREFEREQMFIVRNAPVADGADVSKGSKAGG